MAVTKDEDLKELALLIDYYEHILHTCQVFGDTTTPVLITNTIKHLKARRAGL